MSILVEMLREEQQRALNMQAAIRQELQGLTKGYISRKVINGQPAHYLQWREGGRILSQHVPKDQLEQVTAQIARRRQLKAMEKDVQANLQRIKRALKS